MEFPIKIAIAFETYLDNKMMMFTMVTIMKQKICNKKHKHAIANKIEKKRLKMIKSQKI